MQRYAELPFDVISNRLLNDVPLLTSNEHTTMSLAGAQDKMGLRFDKRTNKLSECVEHSLSTHILKPDTRQKKYQPSAINEYACMKLARQLKLRVPDVSLLRVPQPVYVVERYDRQMLAGNIVGLHQFDACQLLGVGAGWKYQRQAGLVSISKIVKALRGLHLPGAGLLELQRWVMFNYLIGNADAHAKNLSILVDEKGYALAPFYDLLSVAAYGDTGLALYIGDEDNFKGVGAHSWQALCEDCGFRFPELMKIFRRMATQLVPAWEKVRSQVLDDSGPTDTERELLQRMTDVFKLHSEYALSMTQGH